MDVSVLVSTRDQARHLARLLESLAAVDLRPGLAWELVLADNGSSDDTAAVARDFSRRAGFPLRYVFEPRRGKSHGLNAALAVATGRIFAFTDDDAIVAPDWIQRIVDFFEARPHCSCLGGMVKLHDPRDISVSVRLSEESIVVDASNFAYEDPQVIGCNMAMRADLFSRVGNFDTDLGPGSRIGVADDLDMLYRIVRSGHAIFYAPEITVSHNHGRRTREQYLRVLRGYITGRGAFVCKHVLQGDRRVARWAYWMALSLLRLLLRNRGERVLWTMALMVEGALRYLCLRERRPRFARRMFPGGPAQGGMVSRE